jgi:hypothetical protein
VSWPDLVLLAAGLSTRYGRPKQLDPVGPTGASLAAYAVLDALRGGFGRIVVITRPELQDALHDHLSQVLGADLPLVWVHQRLEDLPSGRVPPAGRTRPWGTAHALVAAAPVLGGPFGVANADDWYGPEAYLGLAAFLRGVTGREGALVAYPMAATLSSHGGVSRGRVLSEDQHVTGVIELRDVRRDDDGSLSGLDEAGVRRVVDPTEPASMNLWGLPARCPGDLREAFLGFLDRAGDALDAEFPLSTALGELAGAGRLDLQLLPAGRRWFGVTFPSDRAGVVARLRSLHESGTYPSPLGAGLPDGSAPTFDPGEPDARREGLPGGTG